MSSATNARLAALQAISEVLDQQQSLADSKRFESLKDPRDAAFARRLSFGCLRWLEALQWLADAMLDKPLRSKDRDINRLILLGIYQLWQEDMAPHAALHATAEVARVRRKKWAVGLINGVLRRFQREQDDLLAQLAAQEARWAHPGWMLKRLQRDWPQDWQALCTANNQQAPLWLRHNRLQGTLADGIALLEADGLKVTSNPFAPQALAVEPPRPVQDIPGFLAGRFSVQDAAAQLAAGLMKPGDQMRLLDACAAPGGKTGHLLEIAPKAQLLALDLSNSRVALIRDNLERLKLNATLKKADAAEPEQWWDGTPFDAVLLDAPCSATGVIRRHPDIKWLRNAEQIKQVCLTQQQLLRRLWPLVAPGGILVYATCSVLKCENSEQIQTFLHDNSDASCVGPDAEFGHAQDFGRQILPGEHAMDGFYYAVLRKSA